MKRSSLRRSQQQERRTAIAHGGVRQPGSGNSWARKGDVRTKTTLIEAKRTDARQITLKADHLEKIWFESWSEGRRPILEFELGGVSYVVQRRDDYLEDHDDGAHPGEATVDGSGEVPGG